MDMDHDILSDQPFSIHEQGPQSPTRLDVEDDDLPAEREVFLEDVGSTHPSFKPELGMEPQSAWHQTSEYSNGYSCPATDGEGGNPLDPFDEGSDFFRVGSDGISDRMAWNAPPKPVAAVFIHAGAGYHSTHNENVHLAACSDAAQAAMILLQQGYSAVDAVEAAIKSLENKEITNAGYGSNLSLEGKVECDATIVDQFGRSGACGATPNVRNPICLARLILDASNETLSLRRVPPNLLIGEGAKNFAREHNMPLSSDVDLISANSRERYERWVEDLQRADAAQVQYQEAGKAHLAIPEEQEPCHGDRRIHGGDHIRALQTATWNEGQPDSPQPDCPQQHLAGTSQTPSPPETPVNQMMHDATSAGPNGLIVPTLRNPLAFVSPTQTPKQDTSRGTKRRQAFTPPDLNKVVPAFSPAGGSPTKPPVAKKKTSRDVNVIAGVDGPADTRLMGTRRLKPRPIRPATASLDSQDACTSDAICDTVGAIAIDLHGAMASGSSSGGIGMKHSGRVGPAALVGIGSAVIPADPSDPSGTTVAAVTSGTGEHMATTMASYKCAERLYNNTRRSSTGGDIVEYDDDAVMESFVKKDFLAHPGVKNQPSQAAIGVMAVKQTRQGYYFYFAHSTDSFALCSMTSNDKGPQVVMSRLGEDRDAVGRGARRIKIG